MKGSFSLRALKNLANCDTIIFTWRHPMLPEETQALIGSFVLFLAMITMFCLKSV